MTKAIYLVTTESHCGKSLISLGIIDRVLRKTQRVGVFRPVINHPEPGMRDKNIDLLLSHFRLDLPYEATFALTAREASELQAHRGYDEFLNRILQSYTALQQRCDFILCIGSDYTSESTAFEFDLNVEVARSLDTPVLIIGKGANRDFSEIIGPIYMAMDAFKTKGCPLLGTIVNRVEPQRVEALRAALHQELDASDQLLAAIPEHRILASPTMREIAQQLHAEILYGHSQLDRQAYRTMVVAMHLENYLDRLGDNVLVVTPGDRGDVILSALQAHQSRNYPSLAGVVLTTDQRPGPAVRRLLDGLPEVLPILAVNSETYETATSLHEIYSFITTDNPLKIGTGLQLFEQYVDVDDLLERFGRVEPRGISPRMFLYNLTQKARVKRRRIVLPESTDERILRAVATLSEQEIVDVILLGEEADIQAVVTKMSLQLDFNRITIVDPVQSPHFEDYAETLFQLRRSRGMERELAVDLMQEVSYFGTMMVYKGHADGMVSGATHTTAHTIRPALQFVKTRPGISIVSSVFFMCLEDRVLVYGDCAVNPKPSAEELAQIGLASAETSQLFGIEPRVAMLSYSSGSSGSGEEVERVRAATALLRERWPDLPIEGPIQYDAAVDPAVGQSKLPGSPVAGHATVLIFPDLNTGNNTYKAVQRETGAIAVGPVLQGLNKPVNDLSRGCTVDDIINTVAITAIQAGG